MRKLLTTLATAATAALGFAEITAREDFEDSSYTPYGNADDKPSLAAPYDFEGYGDYYRSLDDDGEEELSADDASCVDAVMQFKYADVPDEFDGTEKLVVFANSDGKLVVVDADATNVTTTPIAEDVWYRLTIVSVDETVNDATVKKFKVYVNGVLAETEGGADSFKSRVADSNSVATMTLSGTGKVDNFVARTTNPFGGAPAGWIANIGTDDPEQYFTDYTDALKAALAGSSLTFADGETEMDGSAEYPFEIRTVADLKALQAAVAAGNGADKCYVQKADIALTEAWPGIGIQNGKDIVAKAEFDNGAFTGTYDGGNYTISNFQMVDGLDYCGFFNSVKGATIKNLKISYKDGSFAKDMVPAKEVCGATFVGVAKESTLQNLTSLAGTVSCTKGFGGIVGYLMAGSTVDSCTNNVNLTSTASNKAGGIAMITQNGSGTATIRNCQNNGTTAGNANQKGGIVGYVGVATEIADCEDTAGSNPSFLHHQSGTLTMTGVNKAPAGVKSYTKNATNIDGLNLATVDNGVATFVKSADLVLGNTYKVMGPGAAYMFEQAGTLTLDQSLATATVTADTSALILSSSAVDTDTTLYTAAPIVAKIGDTPYASLADAVAAAESGKTVNLVANVTLATRVEPTKSMTIDLGGYTVTPTAACANGSAFDVKSGTVTIKNGTIDGSAITEIECDPITARSGSDVTLEGLTITICSQNGACAYPFTGAKMTIKSGTYKNTTKTPYQYKQGWTGMAVNQGNTATQLLFIEGGSFAQVNPALGDDSWAEGAGTFLAKGYVSTYDDVNGVWVVKKGFPGGASGKTFNIDTAVQAALAEKIPAGKSLTDAVEGMTSGMTYAQAYALGLLDEKTGDVAKDVTPTIEIKNGKVVVSIDAAAKDAYTVMLNVYEKANLTDNWPATPTKTYQIGSAEDEDAVFDAAGGSGFYKVGVVIEDNK